MRTHASWLIAVVMVAAAGTPDAARAGPEFRLEGEVGGGRATSWLSVDAGRIAWGDGTEVRLSLIDRPAEPWRVWRTDLSISAGLLHGDSLLLVEQGTALLELRVSDPDSQPRAHPTLRTEGGRLTLARTPGQLIVAEEGVGLRFAPLPSRRDAQARDEPIRFSGPVPFDASIPSLRGSSRHLAGRALWVAAGSAGLQRYRDRSQQPALFPVTVANNFFSPANLEIDSGDTVRWTNASGFHNVYSCEASQSGCDGRTATESFVSGAPSGPIWVYSYTFTQSGPNRYVCQAHSTTMVGSVSVVAAPPGPPPVPDGRDGAPMRVAKLDPLGGALRIEWDTSSCPGAVDAQIVWAGGSGLPIVPGAAYRPDGGECSIGVVSPYDWSVTPSTTLDPGGLIWWVLVSTDGTLTEGSSGLDGFGSERRGPGSGGSSGECGTSARDLTNECAR